MAAERVLQVFAAVAVLVFLVTGIVYLYLGRWTVTHQDFWLIYEVYFNHSWLESAVLKYYNHSLFFPTLLRLADLHFFHGDQEPLFFVGLALLFITASLLLIPIWRDKTVSLTAKSMSTLVMIVGNFWMGRSVITASGGFNCENSLVMAGGALAFLFLPKMSASGTGLLQPMLIVIFAGLVASFSFGAGVAIWPTLLFLGWCLRLPRYCIGLLIAAGVGTAVVYVLLPEAFSIPDSLPTTPTARVAFLWLFRLVGNPVSNAVFAWWPKAPYVYLVAYPSLATFTGVIGLALLAAAVVPQIIRRDIEKSSLEFTGLALVLFNILALLLVLAGRSGSKSISAAALPRYFFWSALFWTGLCLVGIARVDAKPRLRWIVYIVVLALPLMVFPAHRKNALYQRRVRTAAEYDAIGLINRVQLDEQQIGTLFFKGWPVEFYQAVEQMRLRRLDMFAAGFQDWIGLNQANVFGRRRKPEGLKGECTVAALVQCDNGAPAARVIGHAWKGSGLIPETLVMVDASGIIRGVARSSTISPLINRVFYLGKLNTNEFVGYIRDYNPQIQYGVLSTDNGILSEEEICVEPGS